MQRWSILAEILTLAGVACATTRPIKPVEYIPQHGPQTVWVTAADSSIVPVTAPHVEDDTLRGVRLGSTDTVALALSDVRLVTAKVPDHTKTAILVLGVSTLSTVALYELFISKQGDQGGGVDCGVYESTREGDPGEPRPYC